MKSRMLVFVAVVGLSMAVGCSNNKKTTDASLPGTKVEPALPPLTPTTPAITTTIVDSGPIAVPARTGTVRATAPGRLAKPATERLVDSGTSKAATSSKLAKTDGSVKHYVVKKGDSLTRIAKATYGDAKKAKQIALANKITDPNKIRAGQVLVLPAI